MIDLRGKAGPCIHMTKHIGFVVTSGAEEFYIPYFEFPNISTRQELRQPIKELYQEFVDILSDSKGWAGAIASAATTLLDIFGIQIASKNFYSQSWKGGTPTAFSLNLNFFRGITGNRWDAFQDVYNPIMVLISNTVPKGDAALLIAPVPSSLAAFTTFTTEFIKDVIDGVKSAVETGTSSVNKVLTDTGGGYQGSGTWTMDFGWQSAEKSFTPMFRMAEIVVESTSFKFSPMVEVFNNKAYPISGTVTMSCKTQNIISTDDLDKHQPTPDFLQA